MNCLYDVTFIIPAYNVENYIRECVDSILKQKEIRIEIIIIDDGSKDNTADVLKAYYAVENIKVIKQSNKGVAATRNVGIENATGKYIAFVDGDDFFDGSDKLASLYEKAEANQLDVIRGYYHIFDEEENKYIKHDPPLITFENKVLTGYEFLQYSVSEYVNEVVPWLGLFSRNFLLNENLRFPSGIAYEEDQLFFLEAMLCNKDAKFMQSDEQFYVYRKRKGSATKTPTRKQAMDVIDVVTGEEMLIKKFNVKGEVEKAAKKYICSSFYQLTSIYGRVAKTDQKAIGRAVPFKIELDCLLHPYSKYQFGKIFLFTFARPLVRLVYAMRR